MLSLGATRSRTEGAKQYYDTMGPLLENRQKRKKKKKVWVGQGGETQGVTKITLRKDTRFKDTKSN